MRARSVFALAACALVVAGVAWWAVEFESVPIRVPPQAAVGDSSRPDPLGASPEPIAEPSEIESPLAVEASSLPAETAERELAPVAETDFSRCVLVGRVVDGDGRPLAGVSAAFRTYGPWSEAADATDVAWIVDGRYRGLDGSTGANGEFRVEAPVPTAKFVELRIELDPYHTALEIHYGGTYWDARRAIVPGENDLRTFTLNSAGTVSGRVVGEDGAPLVGAQMSIGSSLASTVSMDECETDDAGFYRIEHAPEGEFGVSVQIDGYLCRFESPVVVEPGTDVRGPDFVLTRSPTLEGIVLDELERPISGTRVVCWADASLDSSIAASAVSGEDGSFSIPLHHDVPHRIEATAQGHDPFTSREPYPPGARGIEIVLPTSAEVLLRVVDRATQEPIETFDTFVERDDDYGVVVWPPNPQKHPEGLVRVDARPGTDRIRIRAPGYAELTVLAKAGERTVRLRSGPEVRGRLLANGRPVPGPTIVVEPYSSDDDEWERLDVEKRAQHRGDADGSFRIGLSDGGVYRVEIHGPSATPLLLVPVDVPEEGILDLGDLELPRGAAIDGRVELPPGVPLDRFEIHVPDVAGDEALAETNERGEFHLEHLPPGRRVLVAEKNKVLEWDPSDVFEVDLADGEQRSIVLVVDPTRLLCRLEVTVLSAGVPLEGLEVSLERVAGTVPLVEWVGETDEHGVASDFERAGVESRLVLAGSGGFEFVPDIAPITLQFGAPLELVVELEAGRLEISWPAAPGFEPPAADAHVEEFVSLGEQDEITLGIGLSRNGQSEQVNWRGLGSVATRESGGILFHVLELGPLEPGSYVVRVMEAKEQDGWQSESSWSWPPPFRPQRVADAVVVAGQVATCRF